MTLCIEAMINEIPINLSIQLRFGPLQHSFSHFT